MPPSKISFLVLGQNIFNITPHKNSEFALILKKRKKESQPFSMLYLGKKWDQTPYLLCIQRAIVAIETLTAKQIDNTYNIAIEGSEQGSN